MVKGRPQGRPFPFFSFVREGIRFARPLTSASDAGSASDDDGSAAASRTAAHASGGGDASADAGSGSESATNGGDGGSGRRLCWFRPWVLQLPLRYAQTQAWMKPSVRSRPRRQSRRQAFSTLNFLSIVVSGPIGGCGPVRRELRLRPEWTLRPPFTAGSATRHISDLSFARP